MPKNKKQKDAVRARMAATGENYTEAQRALGICSAKAMTREEAAHYKREREEGAAEKLAALKLARSQGR